MEEDLSLSLAIEGCFTERKGEKLTVNEMLDNEGGGEKNTKTQKNLGEPLLMNILSIPSVSSEMKNKQTESLKQQFTRSMNKENNKAIPALPATSQAQHSISMASYEQEKQSIVNKMKEDEAHIPDSHVATVSDIAAINYEEENSHASKKLRLSKEQALLLEESFRNHVTLNPNLKLILAKQLGLQPRQVEVWFQNRRARTKLKQTEIDCKYLKQRYHMLSQENCRLKREVAELRVINTAYVRAANPFYKHMPAMGGLSFCPCSVHSTSFFSDTTTGPSDRNPATFASLLSKPRF